MESLKTRCQADELVPSPHKNTTNKTYPEQFAYLSEFPVFSGSFANGIWPDMVLRWGAEMPRCATLAGFP